MSLRRNIGNIQTPSPATAEQLVLAGAATTNGPTMLEPATSIQINNPFPAIADSNTTAVPSLVPGIPNTALYIIGGLGAVYLLTRKKTIGATEDKKEKSLLPLLLIGGGVAAWWWWNNKNTVPAATTVNQVAQPATGGNDTIVPPVTVQTPVASLAAAGSAVDPLTAIMPLPINADVYNNLYAYSIPWRYAVDRMTAAERADLYEYVFAYLKNGLRLYDYPGIYYDGYYDANLFGAIKELSDKWNLGLLN
jgi:hypothetical protein